MTRRATPAAATWPGRRARRGASTGLSIVELMVGITIALFIMAGATLVLTTQLGDNRRLLLETQLQQDLRTTADMIARDVRRAGHWGRAYCNVWPNTLDTGSCRADGNPYNTVGATGSTRLVYDRSTDADDGGNIDDDGLIDDRPSQARERVGFRWNETAGSIEYLIGDTWQALTDPEVVRVTQFSMVLNTQTLPVPAAGMPASGPACGGPLSVQSRNLTVTIVAEAKHDSTVRRSVRDNVRLRNSVPVETCP